MGPQTRETWAFAAMGNFKPDRENPLLRHFVSPPLFLCRPNSAVRFGGSGWHALPLGQRHPNLRLKRNRSLLMRSKAHVQLRDAGSA